ncbi:MAG: MFS transporter [Proteiniphilum sp.]|nr:MFS transporter [Proteiniphilum sp.]
MNPATQKKNYALPIAVMFMLFFMISFVTGLQNPMGVIVKNQFGASNAMSQLGNLANFIAYAFMGIPAGIILERKGYKFTSLMAVAIGFTGVAITFLSGTVASFGVYLTGAFISGFSMCMLNTVVNPMLNTLGGGGNKGNQLIQFGGAINSIGATIVPILVGYLMGDVARAAISDANPALFLAMGIFAFAFIVILVVKIPEPRLEITRNKKNTVNVKDKHSALSFRHFVLGIVAIFIYVGVEVGIPNIANLYMTTDAAGGGLNIAAGVAGSVVGLYWLLMLAGRLVGASIGAKVSSKTMLTATSSIGILLILLAIFIPSGPSIGLFGAVVPIKVFFLVLGGLCTSIMWGSIFNLAVEGLGKYTEMASGIFMVMVCGGGILPYLQGLIADNAGFLNSYWLVIAGLVYLFYYAVVGSKNVNTNIVVTDEDTVKE